MSTLYTLQLQLQLRPDLGIDIVCDHPLATIDNFTRILTISLPRNPHGRQSVRFEVLDPAPEADSVFYAALFSGASHERLISWSKVGNLSRSPDIPAGSSVEIWATVLAVPPNPDEAKPYHGRRNVKIATQGGGDFAGLNPGRP